MYFDKQFTNYGVVVIQRTKSRVDFCSRILQLGKNLVYGPNSDYVGNFQLTSSSNCRTSFEALTVAIQRITPIMRYEIPTQEISCCFFTTGCLPMKLMFPSLPGQTKIVSSSSLCLRVCWLFVCCLRLCC